MRKPGRARRAQKSDINHLNKEIEAYQLMGDLSILAASMPQTAFLEIGIERIMQLIGFDAGGLYQYDENSWEMRLEVSKGISSELYEKCKIISLQQPNILHEALFTKRPVAVENLYTHKLTKKMKLASKKNEFISFVAIPIFRRQEPLGAVIGLLKEKRKFSRNEINLLEKIVVPLSHALECSRLFGMINSEKRKLGNILYVLHDGVFTVDMKNQINFWNRAAEEITGMRAGQVMGKNCFHVFVNQLVDRKGKAYFDKELLFVDMCAKEKFNKIEGFFTSEQQEKKIFLRMRLSPYWQVRGKISGCIVTFEDATLQWEIGRLKENWRSMLTHDLKTPLTATFGSLRILSTSKNLDQRDKRLVEIGIQAYQQMLDLVNLYLDVEKFNAGKMVTNPQQFKLRQVVEQSLKNAEVHAEIKHVKLKLSMESDCEVIADKMLIGRILDNLIGNAVKSILRKGNVCVIIEEESKNIIRISVTDDGIGIHPHDIPYIFERFYQASTYGGGKNAGSGLGLTFCKQVMQAHGQNIRVDSKPNKGSTFCFTLQKLS